MIKLGIIGAGRIASRFVKESRLVPEVEPVGVLGIDEAELKLFAQNNQLNFYSTDFREFLDDIDAVYIASPHLSHYDYIVGALEKGKHVLCEKPMVLSRSEAESVYKKAYDRNLILMEALKTAYAPGFIELVKIAGSGIIGDIKNIDASFTKLVSGSIRELRKEDAGGSMTELSTYPLVAAIKLLGTGYEDFSAISFFDKKLEVDLFTKFSLTYSSAIFTGKVGLGVKSEGDMIIAGTRGYIYVPSPWWKTTTFEVRFEDYSQRKLFNLPFEGDGLHYELKAFAGLIGSKTHKNEYFSDKESIAIITIIEKFLRRENVRFIN
jgi:predicted dehydrogenase